MKKSITNLLISLISITALPLQTMAESTVNKEIHVTANDPGKAISKSLNNRINEIHSMDISSMSSSEKKELRKEVQTMKKMIRQSGGGIYISVGAIIIILLLLIILL
jgi:hypothetical protein